MVNDRHVGTAAQEEQRAQTRLALGAMLVPLFFVAMFDAVWNASARENSGVARPVRFVRMRPTIKRVDPHEIEICHVKGS